MSDKNLLMSVLQKLLTNPDGEVRYDYEDVTQRPNQLTIHTTITLDDAEADALEYFEEELARSA